MKYFGVLVWAAITNYPGLDGLKNGNLFLTVLKAGKSESKVLAWLGSGENPLPGSQMATFLLCPHMAETRERKQALFCLF